MIIFTGTFNPPHLGHLLLLQEVHERFPEKKILFIPSGNPGHKERAHGVSPEDCYQMLSLALKEIDYADILFSQEGNRNISFAIDALREFYSLTLPQEKPFLLLGDDLFQSFHTWKDKDEILTLSRLLIAHRVFEQRIQSTIPHEYIDNLPIPLSSSYLRKRMAEGKSISFMVSDKVKKYIDKNKLYQGGKNGGEE